MRTKVFANYSDIDIKSDKGQRKFVGAITNFMREPDVAVKLMSMGITTFDAASSTDAETKVLIDKIQQGPASIDVGYTRFFDVRDLSGVPAPAFEVRDVSSGLTFSKRPQGGRARIQQISGDRISVFFDTYGGGLEFDQAWFEDQQWWLLEDNANEFRNKWYLDKSTVMYTLIGAIGAGDNEAYSGSGDTQLEKDINTINSAAGAMITRLIAAGLPVSGVTPLVLLSPIQLMGRAKRAIQSSAAYPQVGTATLPTLDSPLSLVVSGSVKNAGAACTDKWYLGCPGIKNKLGEKMPLTVFSNFKAEAYATTFVGWGRYGAYLNTTQFTRISTA